ncbi:MAG TPA: hypothetical protein VGG29_20830 [Caulobacteraceae bacterium]
MAKTGKRRAPADPQVIMARAGERRAIERQRRADPGTWGIAGEPLLRRQLHGDESLTLRLGRDGPRDKVIMAERADGFTLCWRAGGVSKDQFIASQRYVRDVMLAAGAKESDGWRLEPAADAGGALAHDGVTQVMVDASRRVERVRGRIGGRDRRVLDGFTDPMLKGEHPPWRDVIYARTGVAERHRQGEVMAHTLENLRLGYDDVDAMDAHLRKVANDNYRPFGSMNDNGSEAGAAG